MDGEDHCRQGKHVWHIWEQRKPVRLKPSGQEHAVVQVPGPSTAAQVPYIKWCSAVSPLYQWVLQARDEVREVMGGDPCWVSQDFISTWAFILSQGTLGRFEAEE